MPGPSPRPIHLLSYLHGERLSSENAAFRARGRKAVASGLSRTKICGIIRPGAWARPWSLERCEWPIKSPRNPSSRDRFRRTRRSRPSRLRNRSRACRRKESPRPRPAKIRMNHCRVHPLNRRPSRLRRTRRAAWHRGVSQEPEGTSEAPENFPCPFDEDIGYEIVEPPEGEESDDGFASIPPGPTEEVNFEPPRVRGPRRRRDRGRREAVRAGAPAPDGRNRRSNIFRSGWPSPASCWWRRSLLS